MKKLFLLSYFFLLTCLACVTTPSGKKAFIITSESEESQLGNQAFQQVLQEEKLSHNQKWKAALERVGKRIAAVVNKNYAWKFALIESKQKNAFALPGGKVAFYTGIFPICENEAGLATVMGHEIAHVTSRHSGQRITQAFGVNLGLAGLSALIGGKSTQNKKDCCSRRSGWEPSWGSCCLLVASTNRKRMR
ncbi:MAG: M48 family metallopeptidase [Bdellovibrionota bacterium]